MQKEQEGAGSGQLGHVVARGWPVHGGAVDRGVRGGGPGPRWTAQAGEARGAGGRGCGDVPLARRRRSPGRRAGARGGEPKVGARCARCSECRAHVSRDGTRRLRRRRSGEVGRVKERGRERAKGMYAFIARRRSSGVTYLGESGYGARRRQRSSRLRVRVRASRARLEAARVALGAWMRVQ